MRRAIFLLLFVFAVGPAVAQTPRQSYPLQPFSCPPGQFVYGFNPVTHGLPGWFCATAQSIGVCPAISTIGTFTCATVTVDSSGCVTGVINGTCGGTGGALLTGGGLILTGGGVQLTQ